MTEDGAQPGFPPGGPTGAKLGWYRSRRTGQLRYWNGDSWTDISGAITPFTYEAPKPPPAPPEPTPPPPPPANAVNKRRRVLALSVAAIVVVLAIVGAISLGNNKTVNLSTNHAGASTPSPSGVAGSASSGGTAISPLDSTSSAPFDASTTTALTPTTTPPLTSGSGGSGGTSPAPANAEVDVAIIGDSISEIATPDLTHALRQYNLYIDAVGGTEMAEHLAKIEHLESDGLTRDWVVELGTNDVLGDNPNWEADFANEVAALQAQTCVVLVTVNPRLGSISLGINEAIAGAVAAHPNFHALDWGSIELNKSKWLLSDGIHPSKSGSAELARLARKAILGCQGG